jgi:3-oxoacyl-[acyl-carrier-protein] synthase II
VAPESIDYLNAHATATPVGDVLEVEAIRHVFGEHVRRLPVSSTKSMTGHMTGAAGAAEAAITILALARGVIPPTINLEQQDPSIDVDCVPNVARPATLTTAMSNSFGFGGTNASIVIGRTPDER